MTKQKTMERGVGFSWTNEELDAAMLKFREFCVTVASMRNPNFGCAWVLDQDHIKLVRYLIEEAYENAEALLEQDTAKIMDELGDLLLQVVLHGQIAKERGKFSVMDSIEAINAKMRRRHPHVFDDSLAQPKNIEEVEKLYEKIKSTEPEKSLEENPFEKLRNRPIPAFLKAREIGKISRKINFDWTKPIEVYRQLQSEMSELGDAIEKGDLANIKEEMGDVFFTWTQLARHLDLDTETLALQSCNKFINRFSGMIDLAKKEGKNLLSLPQIELENFWNKAKHLEK